MPLPTGQPNSDTAGIWRMFGVGWTLVCELIAGLLIGWGIDWLAGTEKVFTIVGAVAGLVVGMTGFIRSALAENRRMERGRKKERADDA
ncbi:MAG: AtpZ/AtpI family protein [Phycisphaerales bacterium]|nr:AtpZ/AtpI family protein [Phycisphaerales bacterium]